MKKILVISSFIFSALFADNSLGTPLSPYVLKPQQEIKSYNKNVENPPKAKPQHSKQKFRKDDHRYDKRYNNFDYDRDGYYDNYGYYYGYYDNTGYFYNNIFFTYNSRYSYYDREHLRGHFRPSYQNHRVYEYHVINDWNRVHCYREPNSIVYGYYYDRPSYNTTPYRSSYYNNSSRYSRDNARMHTNRNINRNTNRNIYRRDTNQRENYYRNNNRQNNNYRNQNNNNHNSYRNRNERRSDTRMRTRNSSNSHRITTHQNHNYGNKSNQHSTAHMQLSR